MLLLISSFRIWCLLVYLGVEARGCVECLLHSAFHTEVRSFCEAVALPIARLAGESVPETSVSLFQPPSMLWIQFQCPDFVLDLRIQS